MNLTFDEKWLAEYCARTGQPMPDAQPTPKRTKYGNRRTQLDGMTFDSKHESEIYAQLKLETQAGEHAALMRQVAFLLPGGVKYVADFVTLEKDGGFRVWDAKSSATARDKTYRIKKRLMRECMGIRIIEI